MKSVFTIVLSIFIFGANAQIPKDSLFFYANFNGNNLDQISQDNGTLSSGATYESDRHSIDSNALYVDGSNDYVDFGNTINGNLNNIRAFSVSFWMQPEDIDYSRPGGPTSGRYTLFGDIGSGRGFRFFQEEDEIHFSVSAPTDYCYYQLSNREKNNWLHVVGVSDSGDLSIYVNGNHIRTVKGANSNPKIGSQNFEFGRGTVNNTGYWEGRLDEVRMYNRVLSSNEITSLYKGEKGGVCFVTVNDTISVIDTNYVTTFDTLIIKVPVVDTITVLDTNTITVNVIDTNYRFVYDTISVTDTVFRTYYDTLKSIEFDTFRIRTYDTLDIIYYDSIITRMNYNDTVSVDDTLFVEIETGISTYPVHEIKIYTNTSGSIIIVDVGDYSELTEFNFSITNPMGNTMWSEFVTQSQLTIDTQRLKGDGLFNFNIYDEPDNLILRKALMIF